MIVDDEDVEEVVKNGPLHGDKDGKTYGLSDDDVPEEYTIPITDPEEVEEKQEELNEQNEATDTIDAVETKDGETTLQKDAQGRFVVTRTSISGLPTYDFLPSLFVNNKIQWIKLSGSSDPYATAAVTVHSSPLVKVARADETGEWTMLISVEALDEGEHTAYLQTEAQGVSSDQAQIARFVVVEETRLSNTTWMFIINAGIIMLVLIVVFGLQVSRRHSAASSDKKEANTIEDKVEKKEDAPATDKEPVQKEEPQSVTDNEPTSPEADTESDEDSHNPLGV